MDPNKYGKLIRRLEEPAVPPGNPIADYLDSRASQSNTDGFMDALQALAAAGLTLPAFAINPGAGLGMGGVAAAKGYSALDNAADFYRNRAGAEMWANRFGQGDPNQGLPGTPSGPAYRRR